MKYLNSSHSSASSSRKLVSIVVKSLYGLGWVVAIGLLFNQQPQVTKVESPDLATVCAVNSDIASGQSLTTKSLKQTQILRTSVTSDMIESCENVNLSRPLVLGVTENSVVLTSWFAAQESLSTSIHEAITQERTVITMLASDFHVLPSEISAKQEISIIQSNKSPGTALQIVDHTVVLAVQPVSEKEALLTFSVLPNEALALAQSRMNNNMLHLVYNPKHVTPTPTPKAKKI